MCLLICKGLTLKMLKIITDKIVIQNKKSLYLRANRSVGATLQLQRCWYSTALSAVTALYLHRRLSLAAIYSCSKCCILL